MMNSVAGMGGDRSRSSSSGEEDGDADWRAAINSVASTTINNGIVSTSNGGSTANSITHRIREDKPADNNKTKEIKHCQLKAQKLLDDILEKSIEIVSDPIHDSNSNSAMDEGGIRLFKDAPIGIVFDHVDELQGPRKRPRIVPGKEFDEKSKKFRRQLESVTVDGMDIITAAQDASQKSLAKLEARDAAAKTAAKKEEERISELKKTRGERWLPSIARDMQIKSQCR